MVVIFGHKMSTKRARDIIAINTKTVVGLSGKTRYAVKVEFRSEYALFIDWGTANLEKDMEDFRLTLEKVHDRDKYVESLEARNAKLEKNIKALEKYADALLKRNVALQKGDRRTVNFGDRGLSRS